MSNLDDLQDVVNSYMTLSEMPVSEKTFNTIVHLLKRSCNKDINNFINTLLPSYSEISIETIRIFLYNFVMETIKNFVKNSKRATNQDLVTIVISIREITNDSKITLEANNILNSDTYISMNRVTALCNSFLNSN
jgi:hypothetical protein